MSILEKMQHLMNIIKHDANFLRFNAASKVVCDSSADFSNREGKLKKKVNYVNLHQAAVSSLVLACGQLMPH